MAVVVTRAKDSMGLTCASGEDDMQRAVTLKNSSGVPLCVAFQLLMRTSERPVFQSLRLQAGCFLCMCAEAKSYCSLHLLTSCIF